MKIRILVCFLFIVLVSALYLSFISGTNDSSLAEEIPSLQSKEIEAEEPLDLPEEQLNDSIELANSRTDASSVGVFSDIETINIPYDQVLEERLTYDLSGKYITDSSIKSSGEPADFNPIDFLEFSEAEEFRIMVDGQSYDGVVTKNLVNPSGNRFIKVSFNDGPLGITAYYGNKSIRGKAYTDRGAFIYESDGRSTYIMSLYEYKEINNALYVD